MSQAMDIGLRLKAARKAASYKTACAFAKHHHIPVSTYSQHENGKRVLNADILLQYGELLNVSPGWILSGTGDPYMDNKSVSDKKEVITRELFTLNKQPAAERSLAPIEGDIAWVDMRLFSDVLLRFVPLLRDVELPIEKEELMAFAIEVYNGVVMTSATQADKLAMIDLSITSLKRGAINQRALALDTRKSA